MAAVNSEGESAQQEMARLQANLKNPAFKARIPAINKRLAQLKKVTRTAVTNYPGTGKATDQLLDADKQQADETATKQIGLTNPTTTNPLGTTTTTLDANGNPVVNTSLSAPQQKILSAGEGLTSMGQDLAKQQLEGYKPFSFNGDADRARIEDEVYNRLTRNTDRDYAREKEQMEQTLHNRGIALDPSQEQYKSNIGALDERYDSLRANARADATQLGGEELSRSYGINLGTHQQGLSDTSTLQGMGTGLMMPNAPGYNAPTYNPGATPAEMELAFKQLQQQKELEKWRNRGGGTTDTQSPFDT